MYITQKPPRKRRAKKNKAWFKKGENGNPQRNMSPERKLLMEARQLTKDELFKLLNWHIWMTRSQLEAILADKHTQPMISHMIASIIAHGVIDGSVSHLNFILHTILGKLDYVEPAEIQVNNIQVTPPTEHTGPIYVVELNDAGKFRTARPRERTPGLVIDAKASNG